MPLESKKKRDLPNFEVVFNTLSLLGRTAKFVELFSNLDIPRLSANLQAMLVYFELSQDYSLLLEVAQSTSLSQEDYNPDKLLQYLHKNKEFEGIDASEIYKTIYILVLIHGLEAHFRDITNDNFYLDFIVGSYQLGKESDLSKQIEGGNHLSQDEVSIILIRIFKTFITTISNEFRSFYPNITEDDQSSPYAKESRLQKAFDSYFGLSCNIVNLLLTCRFLILLNTASKKIVKILRMEINRALKIAKDHHDNYIRIRKKLKLTDSKLNYSAYSSNNYDYSLIQSKLNPKYIDRNLDFGKEDIVAFSQFVNTLPAKFVGMDDQTFACEIEDFTNLEYIVHNVFSTLELTYYHLLLNTNFH
jgi:hypothetical protein